LHVVWSGNKARTPLGLEDGIDVADVALTQAGTPVRWLGRFDVLDSTLENRGQEEFNNRNG
jgi:hypothetical protein